MLHCTDRESCSSKCVKCRRSCSRGERRQRKLCCCIVFMGLMFVYAMVTMLSSTSSGPSVGAGWRVQAGWAAVSLAWAVAASGIRVRITYADNLCNTDSARYATLRPASNNWRGEATGRSRGRRTDLQQGSPAAPLLAPAGPCLLPLSAHATPLSTKIVIREAHSTLL